MFEIESVRDAIDYITSEVADTLEYLDHLQNALELVGFSQDSEVNLNKKEIVDLKPMEKALERADQTLDSFASFTEDWEENAINIARESYEEDYKEDYESFEDFMDSPQGRAAFEAAQEELQFTFEEDEVMQEVVKMMRRLGKPIDERSTQRVIAQIKDTINDEFGEIKETVENLPYGVIQSILE